MNQPHGRPMRGGGTCQMPEGHRGRCASAVRQCSACDRIRPESGVRVFHDADQSLCFMCYGIHMARRRPLKRATSVR